MKSLDKMYDRAEHEIDLIEQDDSLSQAEKRQAIDEIYEELREVEHYFNEDHRW